MVERAVRAYREAKAGRKGPLKSPTADGILEELHPSPVRWAHLAALVIGIAEGRVA